MGRLLQARSRGDPEPLLLLRAAPAVLARPALSLLHHPAGEEVTHASYDRKHRQEYRQKVQLCLDVFETMLSESSFEFDRPLTGMEIECNLVDAEYQPASLEPGSAGLHRRPGLSDRTRRLQHRIQCSHQGLCRADCAELEAEVRASLNAAGDEGQH